MRVAKYFNLIFVLVLAGLCNACGVLYTMNGNATPSTPVDPTIQQVAQQLMRETQLDVSVAAEVKAEQTYVAYDQRKDEKFIIIPTIPIRLTANYLNSLATCYASGTLCKQINVRIIKLAWLPGIASNEGFWLPGLHIWITANVRSNGQIDQKECLVKGEGPSKWMIWVSSYNLTPNFQIAVRNAFTKAFICILMPDSRYNADVGPYFWEHYQVL